MKPTKRKRAPGGGKKRGHTLPPGVPAKRLPPILVADETLTFLRSQPSISDYVRAAIDEKRERELKQEQ